MMKTMMAVVATLALGLGGCATDVESEALEATEAEIMGGGACVYYGSWASQHPVRFEWIKMCDDGAGHVTCTTEDTPGPSCPGTCSGDWNQGEMVCSNAGAPIGY